MSDLVPMASPEAVLLSDLLGRRVVDVGGPLGRLRDLTVTLGETYPRVTGLVTDGALGPTWVPWSTVESATGLGPVHVHLPPYLARSTSAMSAGPDDDDQLRLSRDVVDTQVVDLQEYRLSRVSDVFLAPGPDGSLQLAAVDVGMGATLRRMGLGWLGRRLRPVVVDWQDLHLTSHRGHELQLESGEAAYRRLDSHGIAELLARLSTDRATDLIATLAPRHAAAAIHQSHPVTGQRLVRALSTDVADRLVRAAHPAHVARLSNLRRMATRQPRRRLLRTAGWRRHHSSTLPGDGSGGGTVGP